MTIEHIEPNLAFGIANMPSVPSASMDQYLTCLPMNCIETLAMGFQLEHMSGFMPLPGSRHMALAASKKSRIQTSLQTEIGCIYHRSMVPNHTQPARFNIFNHQLFFRPSSQHSSHAPCHPRNNRVKSNAALMKPILSMKFSCLWVWSPTQNSHSFSLPID